MVMEGVIKEDALCFKGTSRLKKRLEWPGKTDGLAPSSAQTVLHRSAGLETEPVSWTLGRRGSRQLIWGLWKAQSWDCQSHRRSVCFLTYRVMAWSIFNPHIRPSPATHTLWGCGLGSVPHSLLTWVIGHTLGVPVFPSSFPLPLFIFLLLSSPALAFPISLLPWALDLLIWPIQ